MAGSIHVNLFKEIKSQCELTLGLGDCCRTKQVYESSVLTQTKSKSQKLVTLLNNARNAISLIGSCWCHLFNYAVRTSLCLHSDVTEAVFKLLKLLPITDMVL